MSSTAPPAHHDEMDVFEEDDEFEEFQEDMNKELEELRKKVKENDEFLQEGRVNKVYEMII